MNNNADALLFIHKVCVEAPQTLRIASVKSPSRISPRGLSTKRFDMEGKVLNYKEYAQKSDAITMEKATEIYDKIRKSLDPDDKDGMEILGEYLAAAGKYAAIRAGWNLLSREEKADTDENRTACHNKVIFHLNILSRYLASQGKDISWRDELGDEKENRKKIGDFACYAALLEGLDAR